MLSYSEVCSVTSEYLIYSFSDLVQSKDVTCFLLFKAQEN